MLMQGKTNNKKTHKKNTTLIISLSIFVGLFIFILIVLSSVLLLSKYFNQKRSATLSNALKWQETLSGLNEEEPIVTVPNEEQNQVKQNTGKINQTISNEIIDLTINSFEKISLQSSQPAKDFELYKINFSIKNNTYQNQVISLFDFSLMDQNDEEFSLIIPSKDEISDLLDQETNLKPEEKITKNLIFETKQNIKKADFVFDNNADTKILIHLNK